MKVYSIGREIGCDIVINDNTDVISRRHAVLNVMPSGKMTITDQSHNGTYVNGMRISPNVPVPVTRKDNVSFAHIARLDWNQIPDPRGNLLKWGAVAVVTLLILLACLWGVSDCSGDDKPANSQPIPAAIDTMKQKQEKEEIEKREKHLQDSIKQHVQDSLKKARQKGGNTPAKKQDSKKQEGKDKGAKQPKAADSTKVSTKRVRG